MPRDAAFAAFNDEINAAKEALLGAVGRDTTRAWDPYTLKTQTRNGWSAGAVTVALNDLISDGSVVVDDQMQVRARA